MEMLKSSYLFDNVGYQNVLHLRNVLKLQFKTTRQNNEIYKIHHIYTYYTEALLPYIFNYYNQNYIYRHMCKDCGS